MPNIDAMTDATPSRSDDHTDATGATRGVRRLDVSVSGLGAAIAGVPADEALSVLVRVDDVDHVAALSDAARAHLDRLARRCVGVAVVSADPAVREAVIARAARVPYPLTAVGSDAEAAGWLAGQEAVGPLGVRPSGGTRTVGVPPLLADYVIDHLNPPADPVMASLAARTEERFGRAAGMNIGEDEGRFLRMLVSVLGATNVVEVGTFTGMSALWIARGLPAGGRLTCLELDPVYIELAREAWTEAGVDDRIDVVIGPALNSLESLPADPAVDFAFVDADKENYRFYVDALLPRLAPSGLIAVDNTLWGGDVVDPRVNDELTIAVRAFNDEMAGRPDLDVVPLTVGDGVTLIRPRRT